MLEITWYMSISILLIFLVFSSAIYYYTKKKSFKYYALYNFFLLIYIFTKNDSVYDYLKSTLEIKLDSQRATNILEVLNWYIQTIFYSFYAMFAMLFVDLNKHVPKLFLVGKKFILLMIVFASVFMLGCLYFGWHKAYHNFYLFVFVPLIIGLFFYLLPAAYKYAEKHKYFLIVGILIYIFFALLALYISETHDLTTTKDPIRFFYIGIILESLFFNLGIAYKVKKINDEKNIHKAMLVKQKYQLELKTLESLMEGEEKERLRIAKELHDGVNGDLSAIKFKLVSLLETNNSIINEAIAMIDSSCEQVRSISHNLVPPSLRDFNLSEAIENYCNDINAIHKPQITFQPIGDAILLDKKQEANIFRIIQELVTNSIKHAEAKEILVQLSNIENNILLTVEDDGKGFDINTSKSKGIGMQNIQSRVAYLGGVLDMTSDTKGSSFIISLNNKTLTTVN